MFAMTVNVDIDYAQIFQLIYIVFMKVIELFIISSFFKQRQQWKGNRQSEVYYAIEKTVHCHGHPLMG